MAVASIGKKVSTKSTKGGKYEAVKRWYQIRATSLQEVKDIIKRRTNYSISSKQKLAKGNYEILWRNRKYSYIAK